MKRNIIFATFILTAFLLSGCTSNRANGGESLTETTPVESSVATDNLHNTEATQNTDNLQNTTQSQTTDVQHTTQTQDIDHTQNNDMTHDNTVQGGNAQETKITEDEAKRIALTHAGVTSEEVTFIKCEPDYDDGREHYDVEFYTQDKKDYDYEIDPYTGDIIEWDYEPIHDVNS